MSLADEYAITALTIALCLIVGFTFAGYKGKP